MSIYIGGRCCGNIQALITVQTDNCIQSLNIKSHLLTNVNQNAFLRHCRCLSRPRCSYHFSVPKPSSNKFKYQFLKTLSANPDNTIIGIARSPDAVKAKISADNLPSNVHILKGDLTDVASLNAAAAETSKLTGGVVDYLIVNGAYLPYATGHLTAADYAGQEQLFLDDLNASMHANVAGIVFTVNAFIDLVKKSNIKKVIVISSGMADQELILTTEIAASIPYSVSKAGANIVTSKYAALYKNDGVIFLSLSPGFVQTQADPNGPGKCS